MKSSLTVLLASLFLTAGVFAQAALTGFHHILCLLVAFPSQ